MLKRKAETRINAWIKNPKRALLVTGARQVGKTFTIRKCLKDNRCDYIEVNLIQNPDYVKAFEQSSTIDELKLNLSALTDVRFTDGQTFLFIDEVQEFKDIITRIKFWVDDGRIKFVLSGSLLGVEIHDLRSAPVGYLDELDMFPLDFEEFITASGVTEETIAYLKKSFVERTPVSEIINQKMFRHFKRYLVIGGMPAAVEAYIETGNLGEVSIIQENIIRQYKLDFTKYETKDKKLMLTAIFDQIPSQLLKQNKRFNYSDIRKKLRFERLESSFLWLKFAGTAIDVVNTAEPRISLRQNIKSNLIKLYASDVGLLTLQYGSALRTKILFEDTKINIGGVYENFIAQELNTHGYPLFFYRQHHFGELDFVIEQQGAVVPIEVKSGKDYKMHSSLSKVMDVAEYQIEEAYVFANANVEQVEKILYLPMYMCAFLNDNVEYPLLQLDI